ncbi:MAG: phosphodiester glycosidase family protein [Bryobacteraceae bacterium]|nr:phosphodiester glycosidase family protein [Bryobacteraceae bacterium]
MLRLLLLALLAVPGGAEERATHPYRGITWIRRAETQPRPVRMNIVLIDLNAPGIRFRLTPPSGPRETQRQTTLEFLKRQGAQLAISGHFFLPYPSRETAVFLVGLAASEGTVYSGFETPEQSYAIVADAPALNIGRDNAARIVQRRPAGGATAVAEDVTLWNTLAGSARIVTAGEKTIPTYRDERNPNGQLTPGGPGKYSNANSWYAVPNARAVIGLARNRRWLVLFTVDRAAGSGGMRLDEVADLLIRDYGVEDALNLDGGGSTSLAIVDPVTNEPRLVTVSSASSSGDSPAGRAVGSNLAVFASPLDVP